MISVRYCKIWYICSCSLTYFQFEITVTKSLKFFIQFRFQWNKDRCRYDFCLLTHICNSTMQPIESSVFIKTELTIHKFRCCVDCIVLFLIELYRNQCMRTVNIEGSCQIIKLNRKY